jgi:hypothetical protein
VWIYQLRSKNRHVTYLGLEDSDDKIEDEVDRKIVNKITSILESNGYTDIFYDYFLDNSYFFVVYLDAFKKYG